MKKRVEINEIDLIEVIINLRNNKIKIAAITFIFMVISTALYFLFEPPLNAKTKIIPITIFENNLYLTYNSLLQPQLENESESKSENENKLESYNRKILLKQRLNNINKDYLLNLFLEELQTKEIVKKAIKNYQLIDKNKFKNADKYLEMITKKALKLNVIRSLNVDGSMKSENKSNWTIEFEINDEEKWEEALSFIESEINNNIQNYLKINFNTALNNLKLLEQFQIEDIELKIKNVKDDYEIQTENRIAFLREQAIIARKLRIESNTLEVQNFTTPSGVISNLQSARPYYMRGYVMIEKEIELIETRVNKDAFINDLLDLEKQKRDLLENKSLVRIEKLFKSTPIFNDFKAAKIVYQDTEYKASISFIKVIIFAGIFGIIFSIFYVLTSNAIKQRK